MENFSDKNDYIKQCMCESSTGMRNDFLFQKTEEGFLIKTPFTYLDNDNVIVFVKIDDDKYILSDNGESALRTMFSNVDIESDVFLEILSDLSHSLDLKWNNLDNSIEFHTNKEGFKKGFYNIINASILIQAIKYCFLSR